MKNVRRYLPPFVSLALIIVLIAYAPWAEILDILSDISVGSILTLIGLSALYHGLKSVRFLEILRAIGIHQPWRKVVVSYISAQPVSLLPAGEIYRSHVLERHTGVPVSESIGQFTLQGLYEGISLALLAVVCALFLGTLRIPAVIFLVAALIGLVGLRRGWLATVIKQLSRLPFINVGDHTLVKFNRKQRRALSKRHFPSLFIQSVLIELVGTAIAYVAVTAIGGHINFFQAALFYIIPLVAGFLSLLPGGVGVSEQTAVGVLLLSKVSVAHAVAATLIMRATITGMGVLYGAIALVLTR